jgi:ABC-type multidrug transport system fused ATPase/permease subunit
MKEIVHLLTTTTQGYRGRIVLSMFFQVLTALSSTLSITMLWPFLYILFYDTSSGTISAPPSSSSFTDQLRNTLIQYITTHGRMHTLTYVCVLIVIVFFFKNLFRYLAMFTMTPIRGGIVLRLRQQLYERLMHMPISFFSKERRGDLLARCSSDLAEIEISVLSVIQSTFSEPFMIVASLVSMLYIHAGLTLSVFVLLAFTGGIIGRIGKSLKRQSTAAQQHIGNILSIIEESIGGLRIIKAFNAEQHQAQRFQQHNQAYYQLTNHINWRKDLSSPLSEFLGIGVFTALLWIGAKFVFDQSLQAPTFLVFLGLFQQIINPAKSFSTAYYNIRRGIGAMNRVQEILQAPTEPYQQPDTHTIAQFNQHIHFHQVSFAYNPQIPVLQNINIHIPKGKIIALVGTSGAGKTTLADLLPRFYEPTQGHITIDDINIHQIPLHNLRQLISIVTQHPILFNDTVYNNIAFGSPHATPQQVEQAARMAHAHDFITASEHGYQTIIGDNGQRLSGGQRQRLTIARAILKNAPILILDEATSSLDAESERLVQDALYHLMHGRTCIVIAHRLATIQHADQIIVLQQGHIVQQGTHTQLSAQPNGHYARMVALQTIQ